MWMNSHPTWIKERIKIKVGYDNEEMDILIFKPKKSFNKLESVIIYPGANYYRTPPDIDDVNPGEYGLDFIIKSGRALVWPAYKGSMNRITDLNISFPSTQDQFRLFRQLLSAWTVDTSRAIDYLQSREDMDPDNLFYVGMSYGQLVYPTRPSIRKKIQCSNFICRRSVTLYSSYVRWHESLSKNYFSNPDVKW